MADMQAKMAQIDVELKRIESNQETEGAKLALKRDNDEAQRAHQHEEQGFRMGLDMTKHREQLSNQARQSEQRTQKPTKKGD